MVQNPEHFNSHSLPYAVGNLHLHAYELHLTQQILLTDYNIIIFSDETNFTSTLHLPHSGIWMIVKKNCIPIVSLWSCCQFFVPQLDNIALEDICFQQDSTTCYTSRTTVTVSHEPSPGSAISWEFVSVGFRKSQASSDNHTTTQRVKAKIERFIKAISWHCRTVIENVARMLSWCFQSDGYLLDMAYFNNFKIVWIYYFWGSYQYYSSGNKN